MKFGYVTSDLHLLSNITTAAGVWDNIVATSAHADYFVLNGDIFDFSLTTERDINDAVDKAYKMIEALVLKNKGRKIIYVLGNNDADSSFVVKLEALQKRHPSFELHYQYAKVKNILFIHGDLFVYKRDVEERECVMMQKIPNIAAYIYKIMLKNVLNPLSRIRNNALKCAENIVHNIKFYDKSLLFGVSDVYFAHTHVLCENIEYSGYKFHNSGAQVVGAEGRIMSFNVPE